MFNTFDQLYSMMMTMIIQDDDDDDVDLKALCILLTAHIIQCTMKNKSHGIHLNKFTKQDDKTFLNTQPRRSMRTKTKPSCWVSIVSLVTSKAVPRMPNFRPFYSSLLL